MRSRIIALVVLLAVPAIAAAQTGGLTKVQLYALQQQLKAECGLQHATGVMDGPTRHAIAVCNKKYGTSGNGAELLSAMNIGFSPSDIGPGMGTVMGSGNARARRVRSSTTMSTSTAMSSADSTGVANRSYNTGPGRRTRVRGANRDSSLSHVRDSVMRADRDQHGHNQGRLPGVRDTAYSAMTDSLARASRGLALPATDSPKPKKKH
jgi:hypothetical protein